MHCVLLKTFVNVGMIEIYGFSFGVVEVVLLAIMVLTFLIQLFYQILVIAFTIRIKKRGATDHHPSISIILPSRNYEERLRSLVPALLEQNYPDFEVVVVDDCSSDGTEWYLTELKLKYSKLRTSRIVQETDFPNALAITIGIRAATKDWLVFLNPLCRVNGPEWLASYAESLTDNRQAAFGFVKYVNPKGSMRKLIRYENFNSFVMAGCARLMGSPMPVTDMNIAYRREPFLNRRGFAAVLDTPFSENELYLNKIANRKNSVYLSKPDSSILYDGEMDWYDGVNFKKKQQLLRRKFSFGQSFFLWLNNFSRLLFNISAIALVILSPWRIWIGAIWLVKVIHETIWSGVTLKRMGERKILGSAILLRFFLPFLNGIFYVNSLFTGQKQKWK